MPEDPKSVRYLVFEGGGSAGVAYLGAMVALMDAKVDILRYRPDGRLDASLIKGLAGSSSGAVTAALIASGYRPEDIAQFVQNSAQLFEEPIPRAVPFVPPDPLHARTRTGCSAPAAERYPMIKKAAAVLDPLFVLDRVKLLLGRNARELPYRFLLDHPATSLWLLLEDYGVFSGCRARSAIDAMIGRKTPGKDGSPRQNVSFKEHFDFHQVKLVLAGSDVETGALQTFSADTTPDFVVADAVRIAMGFPIIFKPVVIPSGKYEGTWVDSGLVINFPLHAFAALLAPGEKVLGMRLRLVKRNKIGWLFPFISALVGIRYAAGMLSQVATAQPNEIIVGIDTDEIGIFDMVPDPTSLQKVVTNGAKAIMRTFTGQEVLSTGYAPGF